MDVNESLALTIPINGIPATGLYKPPTNVTGFNTQSGENVDPPYNETLIGSSADNIVGSSTNPYLPAILPVYIPTLYANVYSMQTNLVNDLIKVSYDDNRQYPNAKAVKDYVASQLSGFENITEGKVSTSLTSTLLGLRVDSTVVENGGISTTNHIYEINPIDNARNGAEKIVICNLPLSQNVTMSLVTNDNSVFLVLGKTYRYYQFAMQGDMIDMIQFINTETGKNNFIVKTFGGVFSNPV